MENAFQRKSAGRDLCKEFAHGSFIGHIDCGQLYRHPSGGQLVERITLGIRGNAAAPGEDQLSGPLFGQPPSH